MGRECMRTGCSNRSVKLITHFNVEPRLRINEVTEHPTRIQELVLS